MRTDQTPGPDEPLWMAEPWGGVFEVRFVRWDGVLRDGAWVRFAAWRGTRHVSAGRLHRDGRDAQNHALAMLWVVDPGGPPGSIVPF